jgi:hypothetical protein
MTTVEGYLPRPYGGRLLLFRADGMMAPGAAAFEAEEIVAEEVGSRSPPQKNRCFSRLERI